MKIITVCGSLKFKEEIMNIAFQLSIKGNIVLTPLFPYREEDMKLTEEQINMLGKVHKEKIKLSDAIVIVNVGNYIGESTNSEIEYAKLLNKEIIYYKDLIK